MSPRLCPRWLLSSGPLWLLLAACSDAPKPAVDAGPPPKDPAAHLESFKGETRVERDGTLKAAVLGYLYLGDALETGDGAEAKVRFPGGRFVEVGPDARFTLSEGEGGLVLNVARGLVLTRVPKEAEAAPGQKPEAVVALSILTPFGLTRVGKSEVQIAVGKDSATVEVKIGTIELVSRNGEVTSAAAGQKVELGKEAEKPPLELPAIQVIINAGGASDLKKKGARAWVVVGKKPTPIAAGDAIRVRNGKTTLKGDGSASRVVLSSGAEVVWLAAAKGAGVEQTELELKKGELTGVFAPEQQSRLKVGGGVTLVSDLGGQFTISKTASGFELDALAGDLRVEREGAEATVVEGGSSAKVSAKAVQVAEPGRDPLILPSRLGMKVFHSGLGRVTLGWEGAEDKPYRVEVSTQPSFSETVLNGVVHRRFLSVAAPTRGNLFWRVFDGKKEIDKGSAFFSPEPRSGELDLRRNEVHDGADKTTIYYQDKPPAVTFVYAPTAEAAKYRVSIFAEGALGTALIERTQKEERLVLDGALAEGRYLWSVTPLDAQGSGLKGGKMNKLELAYDNAVPNLTIKSPRNGDPSGASVKVVGIAPVGAKVFVNGKPVALDEKARFDTTAAPIVGRLVFRLVGKNGGEVYTVRTLRR